jgi:pathogenesis-related protein 1
MTPLDTKRAGATVALAAVLAAGCATQAPAPVTPAPKKRAAATAVQPQAQPKPAAPKPAAGPAEPPLPRPEVVAGRAVGSKMSGADARALLDHHNRARAAVGLKPLRWAAPVAAHAQKWAEKLAATSCRMEHSSDSDYGENLYKGTQGVFTALDASRAWEAEKKDLDGPLTRANLKSVGHYTQMVWRETARVGCGEATCNKALLVVCNYDPPGNYLGRKPY